MHLSSANICKINSCLSVNFIGSFIGSGWTCRVNFTCISSGCSWSSGLSQYFSFQAFKIGPIFTPFIHYSVTETLCSVVPYFYCRDGATSVFAIAWFIRNYEIRCGLVAKKSLKIHAYNKRHLIINVLQRRPWRRPAAGIRPGRRPYRERFRQKDSRLQSVLHHPRLEGKPPICLPNQIWPTHLAN